MAAGLSDPYLDNRGVSERELAEGMPVGLFRIELIDYSERVPVELKIKWDGTAPGLAEKRLSVAAFGDALTLLLAGLRRIATNIVGDAFEEKTSKGRFANAARRLDIEITELLKESSGFDSVVTFATPVGDTFPLLNLAEIAAEQLLDALDSESRGIAKNANVRRYLKALTCGHYATNLLAPSEWDSPAAGFLW